MESNDATITGIAFDILQHILCIQAFAIVTRYEVPHDDLITEHAYGAILHGTHPSVRRTEEVGLQYAMRLVAIVEILPTAPTQSSNMVVGMIPNGMTTPTHLLKQFGITMGIVAHHEECCLCPELVEDIENIRRSLRDGTVVESQIDHPLIRIHPPYGMGINPSQEPRRLFNEHSLTAFV